MNIKDLAKQRIEILLKKARQRFDQNPERSHRYAELAWKIKLKTNIKLPKKYKRNICRKCQHYLVPGKNSRIRIHHNKKIITCQNCGYKRRIPLND